MFAALPMLMTAVTSAPPLLMHTGSLERPAAVTAPPRASVLTRAATDSADVALVVNGFHAALTAGDTAAAMRLLASDAVIQENGGVETRADYAQHHLAGDIQFARAVPSVRSGVRVVVAGDAAWTSSTSVTKGTYRDRTINSVGAELMVLSRANGTWRIRAIHWSSRTPRS